MPTAPPLSPETAAGEEDMQTSLTLDTPSLGQEGPTGQPAVRQGEPMTIPAHQPPLPMAHRPGDSASGTTVRSSGTDAGPRGPQRSRRGTVPRRAVPPDSPSDGTRPGSTSTGAGTGAGEPGRASPGSDSRSEPTQPPGAPIPLGLASRYRTADSDLTELREQLAGMRADLDWALTGPARASTHQMTVWETGLQLLDAAYASARRHAAAFAHTPAWQEITRLWQVVHRVWQRARAGAARYGADPAGQLRDVVHRLLDPLARAISSRARELAAWAGEGGRGQELARRALLTLSQVGQEVADVLDASTALAPVAPGRDPVIETLRGNHGRDLDDLRAVVDARFDELDRRYPPPATMPDPAAAIPSSTQPRPRSDQRSEGPGRSPAGRDEPASARPALAFVPRPAPDPVESGDRWAALGDRIQADMSEQPGWAALSRALDRVHAADPDRDVMALLRGLAGDEPLPADRGAAVLRARLVDEHPAARTPMPVRGISDGPTTRPRPPASPPTGAPVRPPAVAARR
jgi:hypothetical protein